MKVALLLVASAAAWVAPLPRVAHRAARVRALRSTADEDASKLADEAAKLRAEIAELEGPSAAPAPAPAAADAAAALTREQLEAIEKERRGGISKDMQKKLLREMQSQGADPNTSSGNPILVISVVIAALAIAVNLF